MTVRRICLHEKKKCGRASFERIDGAVRAYRVMSGWNTACALGTSKVTGKIRNGNLSDCVRFLLLTKISPIRYWRMASNDEFKRMARERKSAVRGRNRPIDRRRNCAEKTEIERSRRQSRPPHARRGECSFADRRDGARRRCLQRHAAAFCGSRSNRACIVRAPRIGMALASRHLHQAATPMPNTCILPALTCLGSVTLVTTLPAGTGIFCAKM
ncbi:Uncharacterised protein [Burkholderia oklahomensis]|nr:hypothetical protein BG90_4250 [Burkholderia oklahomensis C6786]SUY27974.1 Uncharacterised protein [Burkholderia oklahomensis]